MLEEQLSISRFQTYQPATDRTQIQGIPGIPMLITTLSSPGRTMSYCRKIMSNSIPLMNSSHPDNGMTACSQPGLLPLAPAVSEPWPPPGLARGLSFPTVSPLGAAWQPSSSMWTAQSLVPPLSLTQPPPLPLMLRCLLVHHHHCLLFRVFCVVSPALPATVLGSPTPAVFWATALPA